MRTIKVPRPLLRLARDQAGLVSTAQCDAAGVRSPTRTRLTRSRRWRRVVRGVYEIPGTVEVPRTTSAEWNLCHRRQAWRTLLACPAGAIPVGLTALAIHQVWGLPRNLGCQVTYRGSRQADGPAGVRVRQFGTFATEIIAGWEVPTVISALVQALPEVSPELAVVLIDNALNRKKLTDADLDVVRRGVRGRRGAARLHQVWPLVDGRAESPIETRARLECRDNGIPPDDLQVELVDGGGDFLGRGDLGWRRTDGSWVIAEMDGIEEHEKPAALSGDRRRQNAIHGRSTATVLRFTSADLGTGRLRHDVEAALAPVAPATPRARATPSNTGLCSV